MTTYRLSIWYAATPEDGDPQVYRGLVQSEVDLYVRPETGFLRDMLNLEGRGVRKIMLEVE